MFFRRIFGDILYKILLKILGFFLNPILRRYFFCAELENIQPALWLFIALLSSTWCFFHFAVKDQNAGLCIIGGIFACLTILVVYCTYIYCKSEFEERMRKMRGDKHETVNNA